MNSKRKNKSESEMKITLAKALATKNKLAKQIKEHLQNVQTHNSVLEGFQRPCNVTEELGAAKDKTVKLVELKTLIHNASEPVRSDIFMLGEFKSLASNIKSVSTAQGMVAPDRYSRGEAAMHSVEYSAAEKKKDLGMLEEQIEELQDRMNSFNHTTTIEFDENDIKRP